MPRRLLLIGAMSFCIGASAQAAEGPSFSCTEATTDRERAICASPVLSSLDRDLDAAFRAALKVGDRDALLQDQRTWLANTVCMSRGAGAQKPVTQAFCLAVTYRSRISLLQARVAAAETGSVCDRVERALRAAGPIRAQLATLVSQSNGPLTLQTKATSDIGDVAALNLPDDDSFGSTAELIRYGKSNLFKKTDSQGSAVCEYARYFDVQPGKDAVEIAAPYDSDMMNHCMGAQTAAAIGAGGELIDVETSPDTLQLKQWTGGAWKPMCAFTRGLSVRYEPTERICSGAMCRDLERFARAWLKEDPAVRKLPVREWQDVLDRAPEIGAAADVLAVDGEYDRPGDDVLVETELAGAKRLVMIGQPAIGWRDGSDYVFGVYERSKGGIAFLHVRMIAYPPSWVARN
jgi:uncharacterized protein